MMLWACTQVCSCVQSRRMGHASSRVICSVWHNTGSYITFIPHTHKFYCEKLSGFHRFHIIRNLWFRLACDLIWRLQNYRPIRACISCKWAQQEENCYEMRQNACGGSLRLKHGRNAPLVKAFCLNKGAKRPIYENNNFVKNVEIIPNFKAFFMQRRGLTCLLPFWTQRD